jgi:ADP-heptose:LPS heptosyltransferase
MYKKILIYNSGGGLGDTIQLFPIILSLKNHFKNCTFYYIGAHTNHFSYKLKDYNIRMETIDLDIKYFGFRWWHLFNVKRKIVEKKISKFDLTIDLQSKVRNTLILKQIPAHNFFSSTFNFFFCSNKNSYLKKESNINLLILKNLEIFLQKKIKKINFKPEMLDAKYLHEAKVLLPSKNYIGFSVTQGNEYRLKTWPIEKFIALAKKYILIGKKAVFFIEKSDQELISHIKNEIPSAIFPESASEISSPPLVSALATRLEKTVTIDNGIMHMVSLAGTPMVTLFGPTNSEKFSPQRDNVTILDSKVLYNTNDISKISVEDVFNFS